MNKNDHRKMVACVVGGLVLALAGCRPGGNGTKGQSPRPDSSRSDSRQATQGAQRHNDEIVRLLGGIIENISVAESRLQETELMIREEKKTLDEVKQSAKTAHLGGQMSDFRMWQRIGREKKANIQRAVLEAENTISATQRGVESELHRVDWASSGDKEMRLSQINQRLSQLHTWAVTLDGVSSNLDQHETWLNMDG